MTREASISESLPVQSAAYWTVLSSPLYDILEGLPAQAAGVARALHHFLTACDPR